MARSDAPLQVQIPARGDERPVLSRVGVVAVLGFVLGVAWPKLIGAKLGPDVPGGGKDRVAAEEPASTPGGEAPAPSAAAAPGAAEEPGDRPSNKQRAVLDALKVSGCRDKKGKKLEVGGSGGCKALAAERWIEPRLRELSSCPAAIGLEGALAIDLELDFEKKSIRVDQGEKSAARAGEGPMPTSTIRGVLTCAASALETVELEKIPHELPRYTLTASVRFVPPGKSADPPAAPSEGSAPDAAGGERGLGTATVTWEKALLRDAPKDGKVVARAAQGSRLEILEQKDEWYLVKKGDAKGWVYRQAIGK